MKSFEKRWNEVKALGDLIGIAIRQSKLNMYDKIAVLEILKLQLLTEKWKEEMIE